MHLRVWAFSEWEAFEGGALLIITSMNPVHNEPVEQKKKKK